MRDIVNRLNLTGGDFATQLAAVGYDVVMVDNDCNDLNRRSDSLQNFIDFHRLGPETKFVWAGRIEIVENASERGDGIWLYWVNEIGSIYCPGAEIDGRGIRELMGQRLAASEPVILVRQTANALNLDADEITNLPLTRLERFLLACVVGWVRRTGRPVIVTISPALQTGRRFPWPLAIAWTSARRRFVQIKDRRLRWPDPN